MPYDRSILNPVGVYRPNDGVIDINSYNLEYICVMNAVILQSILKNSAQKQKVRERDSVAQLNC